MIDNEFIAAVNSIDKTATLNDSDIIFRHISPLCEIDPDLHFYNSVDFHLLKCNYYEESSFAQIADMANLSQSLSFCHLNIRSIKKNLSNFVTYMDCLGFRFSIIGLTESWMKDDICDLYCIEDYELFEKHRPTKAGGGVWIFIAQKVEYTKRDDLCYFDDYIECVSIEIGRTVFSTNRNNIVTVIYR